MQHHSVNVFLILIFIFSQVDSGIIYNKISETLGNIKCNAHAIGNRFFQHGHQHDPCVPTEHIHPEGQFNLHQGHHRHDHDHSGQWGQFHGQNGNDQQPNGQHGHYDPNQSQSSLGNGQGGQFHEKKNDAQSHPVTEKQPNDESNEVLSNNNNSNRDTIDKSGKSVGGEQNVSETTAVTPREFSSSTPSLDVRIDTAGEVQATTVDQQGGKTILSNIKSNCQTGYLADSKGICREVY